MKVLTSRRFWALVVDGVVTIAMFVLTNYISDPKMLELSKIIVGFVSSVAGVLVVSYTVEDIKGNQASITADKDIQIAAIDAGMHPKYAAPVPPFLKQ